LDWKQGPGELGVAAAMPVLPLLPLLPAGPAARALGA